jgi:hypothetical protein
MVHYFTSLAQTLEAYECCIIPTVSNIHLCKCLIRTQDSIQKLTFQHKVLQCSHYFVMEGHTVCDGMIKTWIYT